MESTNYSLNMKAHLDTTEVTDSLSKLNQSGNKTTRDLEVAVKRLDNAVQDLTRTWEKQARAAERAAHASEHAAKTQSISGASGGVEGGALSQFATMAVGQMGARQLRAIGKLINKSGYGDNSVGRVATGGIDWAATAMVATKGNPLATVGAGLIGAVDSAMKQLVESAQRAADELNRLAQLQAGQIDAWHRGQQSVAFSKEARGLSNETDEQLRARIAKAEKSREAYEEFMTPLSKSSRAFADFYKGWEGIDFVGLRDKKMKSLLSTANEDAALAKLAEGELKARDNQRNKEENQRIKEQRALDRNYEYATKHGESFRTKMELEDFNESLQGMNVQELQATVAGLRQSRTSMRGSLDAAWQKARTTKSSSDIESAETMTDQFDIISDKLKDAEHVLNSLSNLGGKSTASDSPLAQFLSGPYSEDAAKGYDVGGYASLEDAVWKQQLETDNNIKKSVEASQKSLETLVSKVEIIQTNMSNNDSDAAKWGG